MKDEEYPNDETESEAGFNWIGGAGCILGVVLIVVALTIFGTVAYLRFR